MDLIFCRGELGVAPMKRMFLYRLQNSESPCDSVPLIEKMNTDFFFWAKRYIYVLYIPGPQNSTPFHSLAGLHSSCGQQLLLRSPALGSSPGQSIQSAPVAFRVWPLTHILTMPLFLFWCHQVLPLCQSLSLVCSTH